MKFRFGIGPALSLFLASCGQNSAPPVAVNVIPGSLAATAGDAATSFTATVQNSGEAVSWSLSGAGSLGASSGPTTVYTPPGTVANTQSATLTATLGDVSKNVSITVSPVTGPPVTPPTDPDSPTTPPTDPEPPTEPPPTPEFTVTIAEVAPVTVAGNGTATVSLDATTENASDGATTYEWAAEGANAGDVAFEAVTAEDTAVTFNTDGAYTLRLTATNGSRSANATAEVTVNPAPAQFVGGRWNVVGDDGSGLPWSIGFDLVQTGEEVTGTLTWATVPLSVTGTMSGNVLTLAIANGTSLGATVSGYEMQGTIDARPFTAIRTPPP